MRLYVYCLKGMLAAAAASHKKVLMAANVVQERTCRHVDIRRPSVTHIFGQDQGRHVFTGPGPCCQA